jgi:hypothetical protein
LITLLHYRSGRGQQPLLKNRSPYEEGSLSFWSADDAAERRMRSGVWAYDIFVFKYFGGQNPV